MSTTTVHIPIDITQHDIEGATLRSQCNCPVARATLRALCGEHRVVVQPSLVTHGRLELGYGRVYPLSDMLNAFALAFDRGERCEPLCSWMTFDFPDATSAEAFCMRNNVHERYLMSDGKREAA
jgi:hypothetical protein